MGGKLWFGFEEMKRKGSNFYKKGFSKEEIERISRGLSELVDPSTTLTKPAPFKVNNKNNECTYLEGWRVIDIANRLFGFNGWSTSVVEISNDFLEKLPNGKWKCGITAIVRVTLRNGSFHEDIGFGSSEHPSKGLCIENGKKEAVTDANKRAFRLFGSALGNCLYDKRFRSKASLLYDGHHPNSPSISNLPLPPPPHPPPLSNPTPQANTVIKSEQSVTHHPIPLLSEADEIPFRDLIEAEEQLLASGALSSAPVGRLKSQKREIEESSTTPPKRFKSGEDVSTPSLSSSSSPSSSISPIVGAGWPHVSPTIGANQ